MGKFSEIPSILYNANSIVIRTQASWQTDGVSGGLKEKVESLQDAYDAYYEAYYAGRVYRCAQGAGPPDAETADVDAADMDTDTADIVDSVPDSEEEEPAEDDPVSSPVASPIRRIIVIDDD